MQITQTLRRAVQINADGTAVVFRERQQSYRQLLERVTKLAGALQLLGLECGDRVAVLALNNDRYVELLYGVPWVGGIVVPLNFRLSASELIYMLNDSGSRVLVVDDATVEFLPEFEGQLETVQDIVFIGEGDTPTGVIDYEKWIASGEPVSDAGCGGDDVLGIFYTGGTTGQPKGVMITHDNMMTELTMMSPKRELGNRSIIWLTVTPIFHVSGTIPIYSTIGLGGICLPHPKFDPEATMQAIEQHQATVTFWAPTMVNMLLEHPQFDHYDLSSLRVVYYASAPMPIAVVIQAMERLPDVRFTHIYGMTETTGTITLLDPQYHVAEGEMSRIKSGGQVVFISEIRVVDPYDQDVPCGELGEIIMRGPTIMKGYWNKPEQTDLALRGGWMHSGDVGYMDEDGFVYIVDRLKDMIITGGENVYSVEVEQVIYQHPAVAMCAVIGIPDETWGEAIHAVVKLRERHDASPDAIITFCRERIAHYKCPRSVTIRDKDFPLSSAGKILKRQLRAPDWAGKDKQVN